MRYGMHPDWEFPDPLEAADLERKRRKESPTPSDIREAKEAEALRETDPGRWPDWASPARMRRDLERDREEDDSYGY